jgi:hypothetical protein
LTFIFDSKSMPVTRQPQRASVMALVPVPHPKSNALPGGVLLINSITSGGVTFVSQGVRPRQ